MNSVRSDETSLRIQIGETLRMLRKRTKKTQEEMSRWIGVSLSVYRRAEQGRTNISIENLARIMLACRLNITDEHHIEEKNACRLDQEPDSSEVIRTVMKILSKEAR